MAGIPRSLTIAMSPAGWGSSSSSGAGTSRPSATPLARGVAGVLAVPDDGDDAAPQPAGDMAIVSDLGMPAMELAVLCDDPDLYPDEVIGDIATRLGFGQDFRAIIA